jgi:hypothetical protein
MMEVQKRLSKTVSEYYFDLDDKKEIEMIN